ncbi:hypothetical protein PFISCL1PPCAC_8542, partial [Pristionchus fissidentatus]
KKRVVRKAATAPALPALPDVVMRKVFSTLSYRELCRSEMTCKRWQRIVGDTLRKDIQEITIERLGSSSQIVVLHQPPFRRLNITCPKDSYDFLSGVVRRSRQAALKLTTDLYFLANMDKLNVDLDTPRLRKYFASVEDLYLLVVVVNEDDVRGFENMAETLFGQLSSVTLQCHVHLKNSELVSFCIQ